MTTILALCWAIVITLTLCAAMALIGIACCVWAVCAALIDSTKEGRAL